ncbi:hypothetical protein DK870_13725 [Pseudomonas sp. Q1]|nr:hypothetical protein [Pseudomonas sp. Q1]
MDSYVVIVREGVFNFEFLMRLVLSDCEQCDEIILIFSVLYNLFFLQSQWLMKVLRVCLRWGWFQGFAWLRKSVIRI